MTEEEIAEYVEKMKDKPRKQIHHSGYKPTWHCYLDPEDIPWFACGMTIFLIAVLVGLGVIK